MGGIRTNTGTHAQRLTGKLPLCTPSQGSTCRGHSASIAAETPMHARPVLFVWVDHGALISQQRLHTQGMPRPGSPPQVRSRGAHRSSPPASAGRALHRPGYASRWRPNCQTSPARLLAESPGLLETPFRAARPPLSTHLRPPVLARPSAHLASPDGRLAQAQAQAHPKRTTATAHGSSSSRRSPHTPPRPDLMITSTPAGSQWRGCPPPTARPSQQCERQRPKVDVALWTRRSWNPLET